VTLADYVSFICPVVGQVDTVSTNLCKTFVQRRYQMIYDQRNWKDAIDLITGLSVNTTGVMDYPAGIDRIITIRGNGNHLIMPSDAAQVMEIDPTLFERTGDPQIWFDYAAFDAPALPLAPQNPVPVHRIKFLPTPAVTTPIILQGTRAFVQLTHDLDQPVIRGLDETIIAYATGDMLRRQRQYQKAQLLYQEAAAALKSAVQSETEAAGYNARIVPFPESYDLESDYSFLDRLTGGTATVATITENGLTNLVQGQGYIDVPFTVQKADTTWRLVEANVFNTVDVAPLNIFPTLVTNKTVTGFRQQLDAAPDSGNYKLQWGVTS
jgi:hypothetical protein